MSSFLKGHPGPMLKIGDFEMDEIHNMRPEKSLADFSRGDAEYCNNRSVSSWDLPLVEQEETRPEHREDFKTKLARLEKDAYEKGFEQGQRDGLALEKRKMEEVRKQFEDMLISMRDLKPGIYSESEGELLKLVMLIARKVIGVEINDNSGIIGYTIRSAMKFLSDKRKIRIIINPDDMEEVRKLLPDISIITKGGHFQLSEDKAIERGGCVLETGFGKINACIEDQLASLEEEIERQYHSASGGKL